MTLAGASLLELRQRALAGDEFALDELLRRAVVAKDVPDTQKPRSKRGRKPGSGSYDKQDEPLLDEMEHWLASDKWDHVVHAARRVAHKAAGGGTEDNKARRLQRKYERSNRPIPDRYFEQI